MWTLSLAALLSLWGLSVAGFPSLWDQCIIWGGVPSLQSQGVAGAPRKI